MIPRKGACHDLDLVPESLVATVGSAGVYQGTKDGSAETGKLEDRLTPSGSALTTFLSFNGNNGESPTGLIADRSGNLFGTTASRGANGLGTVFEVRAGTDTITALVSFDGTNGSLPDSLIEDRSGNLFGATWAGGPTGDGTIFEVKAGGGTITTVASFDGGNGSLPAKLVEDTSGDLFGITRGGGLSGFGTVFEVKAGSGTITPLAMFSSPPWTLSSPGDSLFYPFSLLVDGSGNVFGTTPGDFEGNNYGLVFEVKAGSNTITTLASFTYNDPGVPNALVEDSNGDLFGTTRRGGANGVGFVFEIPAGTGALTTLASFNGTNGLSPYSLFEDKSGNLSGTTMQGGQGFSSYNHGYGTVFEVPAGTGTITTLVSFNAATGFLPNSFLEDSAGNLVGTTMGGGDHGNHGTVFEVNAGNGWLDRVYLDLLNRAVDPVGQAGWTAELNAGVSRQIIMSRIEQSVEYRTDEVQQLYQQFLQRSAEAGGLNGWVSALGSGMTIQQVEAAIAGSAEFFQNAGGTNQGFVTALYSDLLHRAPDPSGQAITLAALNGGVSRQAVAGAVLSSPECYADLVSSLYIQFLQRQPDPFGFNLSMQALGNGFSEEGLVAVLVGSDEYFASITD
jgi:uncharacterized repeat protein (TIGR03803 family)